MSAPTKLITYEDRMAKARRIEHKKVLEERKTPAAQAKMLEAHAKMLTPFAEADLPLPQPDAKDWWQHNYDLQKKIDSDQALIYRLQKQLRLTKDAHELAHMFYAVYHK